MISSGQWAGSSQKPFPRFTTTPWTLVLGVGDGSGAKAAEALEVLCRKYWSPVHAYARARGFCPHDAQDLTQAFFAHFLEKGYIRAADPSRGRFRSFLLTAFRHFATKQWQREQRLKRGGKWERVLIEELRPEDELAAGVRGCSPALEFDRQWGLAVMSAALEGMAGEYEEEGRGEWFSELKGFLSAQPSAGDYGAVAGRLGVSAGAVAVAVHRLRQRFAARVRMEVEQTVSCASDVEDEVRYLVGLVVSR